MPATQLAGREPAAGSSDSDPTPATALDAWRATGRDLVAEHWAEFNQLIDPVERLVGCDRFAAAAAAAQVAANYAVIWHPGVFASGRLEKALRAIGEAALRFPQAAAIVPGRPLRILHVASQVGAIGGHVRMLWRWADSDVGNRHSVALTRQTDPVPAPLTTAISARGGRIHQVNRRVGGLLDWARDLQLLMSEADLVILHVHNQDVIPFIALAGMRQRPPVALLNHADHVFWIGAGFVDVVVNTRVSGHELCLARRGIAEDRSLLLPLCLEPAPRRLSRKEAKRALGLPPEGLVLLTIARAVKFRSLGGRSFADALVPVLAENSNAYLVVVGAGGAVDWSVAEAAVPGQILVFPERADTATFYEAADVYVDSFPFSSNTSLLEAGLRGVPLLTRYPFDAGCEVMGADSLGFDPVVVRTRNLGGFQQALRHLLTNAETRSDLGARTQATIETTNGGTAWSRALCYVYEQAFRLKPARTPRLDDAPSFHDLDVLMPLVFGTVDPSDPATRLANAHELGLKTMPPLARVRTWASMAWRREFRFRSARASWRYLVPEWLTVRSRGITYDRPLPGSSHVSQR